MKKLVDEKERRAIRERLDVNLVVEAAAGTGKTSELVKRILAVLESGRTTVDRLVAVTFTEKAAGELKLRLRTGLEEARRNARAGSPAHANLRAAVARLEEARINTIHGFCADLLRERPVEARVDPKFRVLTEPESQRLFDETFDRWLQRKLEDPPQGVRRSLRRRGDQDDDGASSRLRKAARNLNEWRDHAAPWRIQPATLEREIDALVQRVGDFARMTERCAAPDRDNLYKDTEPFRRLHSDVERIEAVRSRDYDQLEAALADLAAKAKKAPRKGYGQFFAKELLRETVFAAQRELAGALDEMRRRADAALAAALQADLREVVDEYRGAKERAGVLDFLDLLIRARDLVRESAVVRGDFQRRFTHLFVDEFQDTDPLQAEILLLLAGSDPSVADWTAIDPAPGKLFIVGDPKQSIYRFRRADVGVYLRVKEILTGKGAEVVRLTTSFRAVPSIQRAVNAAFEEVMKADAATLQADYAPLSPFRDEPTAQPSIVALPVPRPYGWTGITKKAIEASLPDAVAAFVQWLLYESGWTVSEREDPAKRVPIAARHVCLLFRRFESYYQGDVTRGYAQALEARGIPHLLVGGKSFHVREEVETMRAALSAVEWPDDELSVFATLHGSLFSISDGDLLLYRHRHGRLHPFRLPEGEVASELRPVVEALSILAELHRRRNYRPVSDTILLLLERTRAHAGFVLRPSGEQVLANVLHIAELARAYEQSGGLSFRSFVERLTSDAESGQAPEAPILEEGSDGVRIMTTHKAKGLEFPVVVLADVTTNPAGSVSRWVDAESNLAAVRLAGWAPAELLEHEEEEARRDEAESVRVAYVAATRARDLLVVPAVGDGPFEHGWVSCLNRALYPAPSARGRAVAAPGCPDFGIDSVVDRNDKPEPPEGCVKPGLHRFADKYGVVWWDPNVLALNVPRQFGIRQEELLGKTARPEEAAEDLDRYRRWENGRSAAVSEASQPALRVQTATQRAQTKNSTSFSPSPKARTPSPPAPSPKEGEGGDEVEVGGDEVEVVELPHVAERPRGARFGALVHAVLATAPLGGEESAVTDAARLQTRILGASDDECAASVSAVVRALAHPLMRDAAIADEQGACRREVPITVLQDDGLLIEGVVDLAYRIAGEWIVVDFKTDFELDKGLDAYRRQVGLYVEAVRRSTGDAARGVLLRV